MSKFKKMSIVAISITVFIVALLVLQWLVFSNVNMWKLTADFENFESDFCVVREYVGENFASEDEKWFFVSITDKHGMTLYDPAVNDYMDIPDNVRSSLETICDYGFPDKDSNLYTIEIHGNRVSFNIENGRYALVYSPDEKPTWINLPDEQEDIKVKKITDDWYHVIISK